MAWQGTMRIQCVWESVNHYLSVFKLSHSSRVGFCSIRCQGYFFFYNYCKVTSWSLLFCAKTNQNPEFLFKLFKKQMFFNILVFVNRTLIDQPIHTFEKLQRVHFYSWINYLHVYDQSITSIVENESRATTQLINGWIIWKHKHMCSLPIMSQDFC